MEGISIHDVVNQMKSSVENDELSFEIKGRYTSGEKKGQIYVKAKARWYQSQRYRNKKQEPKTPQVGRVVAPAFKSDSLKLFDCIEQRPFNATRWSIISFQGKKVIHE